MAMEITATKPKARRQRLSVTVAGTETLVYDPDQFLIHRLNAETATIWQLADGTRDVVALANGAAAELGRAIDTGTVKVTLQELANLGLILNAPPEKRKISRRLLVGGALGAAAASSYIPLSAGSAQSCQDQVDPGFLAQYIAICEGVNGVWYWENFDTCLLACQLPDGTNSVGNSTVQLQSFIQSQNPVPAEPEQSTDQVDQPFEVETIDAPFEEEPTPEPTEVPTEPPAPENTVETLQESAPVEPVPPAEPDASTQIVTEPVPLDPVPPTEPAPVIEEPAVGTQSETQPAPVVEEPVPEAPVEQPPAPTAVPVVEAPPPVVVQEPVPVAPNVDTSVEVEVVIDN